MNRHAYFRQQEKNTLMHHGIKGQKWGVRRYQNPDGTYTEEGKERRRSESQKSSNNLKEVMSKTQSTDSILHLKESDPNYKQQIKRAIDNANLGLNAMRKNGTWEPFDGENENAKITGSDREWFIIEDQTIGYLAVCDLINQGKTKIELEDLFKQAKENFRDAEGGEWELAEFARNYDYDKRTRDSNDKYSMQKWVDACYEIKNSK